MKRLLFILLVALSFTQCKPISDNYTANLVDSTFIQYCEGEIQDFEDITGLLASKCEVTNKNSKDILIEYLKIHDKYKYQTIVEAYSKKKGILAFHYKEEAKLPTTLFFISIKFNIPEQKVAEVIYNYILIEDKL